MSPLKIGIIGGGGIAGVHLPQLSKRDDVELVAIADLNPAVQEVTAQYDIPHFLSDYRELLPLVDAVLICVPTFLHADIAVEALNAGKAVFCEKPLARTIDQSNAIEAAVTASGAPFQVGFVRRFDEEWLKFKEVIQQGKIGRPVIWHAIAAGTGPGPLWFHRDEQGGGPFLDVCIHSLDFALATFGPAKWVFCNGRNWRTDSDSIDTGTATVQFESGDELMIAWSWALQPNVPAAGVNEFIGPCGSITWTEPGTFLVHQGTSQQEVTFSTSTLMQGYHDQMDEFVEVARGEKTPRAGMDVGRESLRLALAIIESAKTSRVIHL